MVKLKITQQFSVPAARLYMAWSDAQMLRKWFAPGTMSTPEAVADCRVGGSYRIVMQDSDGKQHIVGGRYLEVRPHERLAFDWRWEGSPLTTRVELSFKALSDARSELELVHTEFPDKETCDHHEKGWQGCLANLHQFVD